MTEMPAIPVEPGESQGRPTLLVIDDEIGFRELAAFEFGARGYEVLTAADGQEAVLKAGGKDIDVVVSDMAMPKLGGLDTLTALKNLDPKMEIIMATGFATLENAVESMKRGAYDFITKPFQIDDLARLVARALEKRRLGLKVDELKEINRFKSEFLANMSHELRTPMNAILGYTSLHLDRIYGPVTPKQEDALKRVEAGGKNLLQLINGILDLSKLAAGRMPVYLEEFDLGDLLEEVEKMMECLAGAKGLTLKTEIPPRTRIRSDRTKLKQILINLISNAVKFTHEGGITVDLARAPGRSRFTIRVRDTGIGIKAADLPQLFQEFRQLDASSTRQYGGTGLGLVISRKFAQLMGGDVTVESVPGAGSTFCIDLPLESECPAAANEYFFRQAAVDEKKRVFLAIDDDPEVLSLLRDSLDGTGYEFAGAQSVPEGMALARKLRPFAITLDIMMPHQDGWSALQLLKNDPELRSIPVIILSITDNKSLGYALGVTDYILKPFDRGELLGKLKALERGCSPKADGRPANYTVLVADGEKATADYIKETLATEGYQVRTAATGRETLETMAEQPPDVLFLDLTLPDVSGFEVLETVEKDPRYANTLVFVLTSRNLSAGEVELLDKRAGAVIRKGSKKLPDILSLVRRKLETIETLNGRPGGGG
jgi:signal transduction histidine kinase